MRSKNCMSVWIGLFVLVSCVHCEAQHIFSISFSEGEGYTDGPIAGQPAGSPSPWEVSPADTADEFFMIEDEALVVTQVDTTDHWIFIEFPNQTSGTLIVTWDWKYVGPEDANVDVGFCISSLSNFDFDGNPAPNWPEQGVMSRMQQNDAVIDCRNGDWGGGGTYEALASFPYTGGNWISMRYEINANFADQVFDCYAQEEGEDEVQLAEEFGYRRESPEEEGLNVISIWMSGDTLETQCIIDNIVIAGPAPVADWSLY